MCGRLGLGGELFSVLEKQGSLPDAASRFYVASVVATFTHLHALKIIYRDLKASNVVLDARGHAALTDFGLASLSEQAKTFCGTPEYLAPEVSCCGSVCMFCGFIFLGFFIILRVLP